MNPKRKKAARRPGRKDARRIKRVTRRAAKPKSPNAKVFFARREKLIAMYYATKGVKTKAALLKKIRAMEKLWVAAMKKAKGRTC
jgi:hypothetical protein